MKEEFNSLVLPRLSTTSPRTRSWPVLSEHWREYAGKPLTVGIRPEDLGCAGRDDAWVEGEVEMIEDLGSDRFVHVRCGSAELLARTPADVVVNRGESLRLGGRHARLHLFYQGKRIH